MLSQFAPQLIAFIHENAVLAVYAAFVIALLSSLPGPNVVIPAGTILNAIGVLVGAGVVHWTSVLWAAAGAILGMSVSYALGKRFELSVRSLPFLQNRPEVLDRAERLFAQYGVASILIGYFSGPLRAPTAVVAAIAGMRTLQFELACVPGALLWAGVSIALGAVPGSRFDAKSPWLLVMPIVVPALIVVLSSTIVLVRRTMANRQ
jgi:membrane protein DedA with SNARE-associated domain